MHLRRTTIAEEARGTEHGTSDNRIGRMSLKKAEPIALDEVIPPMDLISESVAQEPVYQEPVSPVSSQELPRQSYEGQDQAELRAADRSFVWR